MRALLSRLSVLRNVWTWYPVFHWILLSRNMHAGLVAISRPMAISQTVSNDLILTKKDYLGNKSCMGIKTLILHALYLLWFVFSHLHSCLRLRGGWFAYNDGTRKLDMWTFCPTKAKRPLCDVAQFVAQHFDHCNDTYRCLQEYRPRLINQIRFVFYHNIKDNEINIWQLKKPTRTWKFTSCIMQISCLYASDFAFKNFTNSLNMQKQYEKMFGKRVMTHTRCR